jgi:hypothetical protein
VVVELVGGIGAELLVDAEDLGEGVVEPHLRRGPAEEPVVLGEAPPDRPAVHFGRIAFGGGDAELAGGDALAVEHPGQVVVGDDEQAGRVGERAVLRHQARVDVPVGADQRQVGGALVELAGDRPGALVGREQPVGVKTHQRSLRIGDGPDGRGGADLM